MANEAFVYSLTTAQQATGTASQAGGNDVGVANANAGAMTASVDIGLYALHAKYDGNEGRSLLLRDLQKIEDAISRATIWPPA